MKKNVLFVADQPFEIRFFCEVKKRLTTSINASLVIVDLFTFNFGEDVVQEARNTFENQVFDLKSNFVSWQSNDYRMRIEESVGFLKFFSSQIVGRRSLETLRKSDPYINSFEFSRFYREIPKGVAEVAHSDTIKWCQMVLNQVKPSLLCSISNTMFASNILFELSEQYGIPFLSVMHSRIETRWVPRFDFFYNMSEDLQKSILDLQFSDESHKKVLQLRNNITNNPHFELYPSGIPTVIASLLEAENLGFIPKTSLFARKLARWIIPFFRTVITGPSTRKIRARRFTHSFSRIMIFEALRDLRPIFRGKFFAHSIDPEIKFFFWPLHFRPEGVVLIQGEGKDELPLIETLVKLLPEGYFLVVKESPVMVGVRNASFYKKIRSLPRVILASPALKSRDLIRSSCGVVCLTGTALLEAQLLGKPSWALGSPEFSPFINGSGIDGVGAFMREVSLSKIKTNDELLNKYLGWIFQNSEETDNLLWPSSSLDDLSSDITRLVDLIRCTLSID